MARVSPCGATLAPCLVCLSCSSILPSSLPSPSPCLCIHPSNPSLQLSPSCSVHRVQRDSRTNSSTSRISLSPVFIENLISQARPFQNRFFQSNHSSKAVHKWERERTLERKGTFLLLPCSEKQSIKCSFYSASAMPSSVPSHVSVLVRRPDESSSREKHSVFARASLSAGASPSVVWQNQSISNAVFNCCTADNLGSCSGARFLVACQCKVSDKDGKGECKFSDREGNEGGEGELKGFDANSVEDCEREVEAHVPKPLSRSWLYYLLEHAGLDTSHAQMSRSNYTKEIAKLPEPPPEDGTESPLRLLDLARAALEIAAEDDALVSHSPVPLPVDSYIDRLESMAVEFAGHYLPTQNRSPEVVFEALDLYLYGYKGFRRTKSLQTLDARVFYLNTVLTSRLGTPVMLALIYSELVKRLQRLGVIKFSVDMELPKNLSDLPRPRLTSEGGSIGGNQQSLLLTPALLLAEVLKSLKQLYWPWRANGSVGEGSGFLQAATAAARGSGMTTSTTSFDSLFNAPSSSGGAEVARARAAQLRLQRGIWTSTNFGDVRRALAASERLLLLGVDKQELRDYGMLLFHSGLYGQAFEYLTAFQVTAPIPSVFNELEVLEGAALERLLERLRLILAEQAWTGKPGSQSSSFESPPDPW